MVRVDFDSQKIYPFSQTGAGHYQGIPFQRGYGQNGKGLGNVLRSFWRFISPSLKSIGQDMGKEAMATGGRILTDLSSNNFNGVESSVKNNLKRGARNLISKTSKNYLQEGNGIRGKRTKQSIMHPGKPLKKKTRRDALGSY